MPESVGPVPKDTSTGKQLNGGFEFFYNEQTNPNPALQNIHDIATFKNIFLMDLKKNEIDSGKDGEK